MAWQNPHVAEFPPLGPDVPLTAMPMPMPMPDAITVQPGAAPMPQPGFVVGPAGQPTAPPGMPMPPHIAPIAPPHEGSPGIWSRPQPTCPPGLEYLMALDQLFVDEKVQLLEAFTGWEQENKYVIKDLRGEPVFYAIEESDCCARVCCGKYRACELKVVDRSMKEVIRLSRPFRCDSCFCPCCMQQMEVYSNGIPIGSIVQNWNLLRPSFSILDSAGNIVLQIKGPWCMCKCFEVDFEVKSANGDHKVGRISKKWSGFAREIFTDSDMFGISFPGDLDVKIKAVLIGACLLIDFMYFEGKSNSQLAS